jgi:hypothetical protein
MWESIKRDKLSWVAIVSFTIFLLGWILLFLSGSKTGTLNYLFAATAGPFMSLFGGVIGLLASRQWGGWKSIMGKAAIFLSLGLLAEFLGQVVFSAYNIFFQVEIPYPSLADIGYFGNIPLYLIGIILLARAAGANLNLRSVFSKFQVILFPLTMLIFSYVIFLKNYDFAASSPLTVFLDFGYPLGQSTYVSLALLTYSLSQKTLGGIMRSRILLLLSAFLVQYLSDFNFLFQNARGTWYNGGYGDLLYVLAYFFMTLGLIQLRSTARKISHS